MGTKRRVGMMTMFASAGAAALLAPAGFSATPSQIAADLADGRADAVYTKSELQAYFQSAMVQGYGEPTRPPAVLPPKQQVAGAQTPPASPQTNAANTPKTSKTANTPASEGVAGVQTPLEETATAGTLPFTGVDLALLVAGGMLLLALGFGARRLGQH